VVRIPRQVCDALRAHRAPQVAERLATGPAWSTDAGGLACACCKTRPALVFATELGTPLEPRNVLRRFTTLAARAGLTGVGIHTLRHTAAARLLEMGEDTRVVSDILGHSSTAITADVYQHVEDRMRARAASKLEDVLGAALSSCRRHDLVVVSVVVRMPGAGPAGRRNPL
jgi:integrase